MTSQSASYEAVLSQLKQRASWRVQIPLSMRPFFAVNGMRTSLGKEDQPSTSRIRARVPGLLYHEKPLAQRPRGSEIIGFYTLDFSRTGVGLLVPHELYPGEQLRLLLPTTWMTVQVLRCNHVENSCYESDSNLLHRYRPSMAAFKFPKREEQPGPPHPIQPPLPTLTGNVDGPDEGVPVQPAQASAANIGGGAMAGPPTGVGSSRFNPHDQNIRAIERELGGLFEMLSGTGGYYWLATIRFRDPVDDLQCLEEMAEAIRSLLQASDRLLVFDARTLLVAMPNVPAEAVGEKAAAIYQCLAEALSLGDLPPASISKARADDGESFVNFVRRAMEAAEAAPLQRADAAVLADLPPARFSTAAPPQ